MNRTPSISRLARTAVAAAVALALPLSAAQGQAPQGPPGPGPGPGAPGTVARLQGGPPAPDPSKQVDIQVPPDPTVQLRNNVEGRLDVTYLTRPGFRPLTLDIYRQKGADARQPVVIYVHGGGFQGGSPRMANALFRRLDGLQAEIASRGYTVFAVTYRLSDEAKYPAQIQDVKAAIRWVRANADKYNIDPARVAIWGDSVGGSVSAIVGASCDAKTFDEPPSPGPRMPGALDTSTFSSCVDAVVDWYGVTDMAQLDTMAASQPEIAPYLVHNSPTSSQTALLGCVLHQCPSEVVQRANPITYIDEGDRKTSFIIFHGTLDQAVSYKQSQLLHDELTKKGIPSRLELMKNAGHNWDKTTKEQGEYILKTSLDFLDETIGPKAK